jgi:multiple sugar transport system ATP-binding protein
VGDDPFRGAHGGRLAGQLREPVELVGPLHPDHVPDLDGAVRDHPVDASLCPARSQHVHHRKGQVSALSEQVTRKRRKAWSSAVSDAGCGRSAEVCKQAQFWPTHYGSGFSQSRNSEEDEVAVAKVSLRQISKRFGRAQLFGQFNLEVADGELLCLLGPSGSGKTTLMRIIAGLEALDDGEIWVGEREISALSPRDRHIGMMFQGYALYPHLSVRDNLAYPLRVRHVPREEAGRRVAEVARLLGVDKLLDRSVQQISGGEQQRVAIGRAIVQKPQLYLLDEPISNLDASLRETVRTEVRRLQRQLSATMIMVTHDQMDALAVADRIAVLGAGVLRQIGTPEELYQKPANLFVAGFIGNMRMNLLPCRYAGNYSRALEGQGFEFPLPAGTEKSLPNEGGAVVLGFRPEETDIHVSARDGALPATVETAHFQGDRVIYQLRLGAESIQVSAGAHMSLAPNAAVWISVTPARTHIFDRESGERLETNRADLIHAIARES